MPLSFKALFSAAVALTPLAVSAIPTSYANAFVDPRFLVAKSWSNQSTAAQDAIVSGAHDLALQGPWSVVNKTILSPTNNTHDYLSFAPYWWPDCSNVGNTTELTQNQVWTECKYVNRDGQFNPDQHLVNNTGDFSALGDAILYSSIAWALTGDSTHASNIAKWINVWFVDQATVQTPNLNYAQLIRGVGMMVGVHTGLLDFKGMAKIATGVLTLKLGGAAEWDSATDAGFKAWINAYLPWINTNKLAIGERDADNNHGSFFFNQLTALYLILDDKANAKKTLDAYFTGIFQGQINANGEQPLEAERTHPIHYRAYNLGAIFTNAQMGDYLGLNYWNTTTKAGGTIQKAVDYAMVQSPVASNEAGAVKEIYQIVAATATVFGDPDGKYKKYLEVVDPSEAFFLWDFHATINASTTITSATSTQTTTSKHNAGGGAASTRSIGWTSLIGFSFAAIAAAFVSQ